MNILRLVGLLLCLVLLSGCQGALKVTSVLSPSEVILSNGTKISYAGVEKVSKEESWYESSTTANKILIENKKVSVVWEKQGDEKTAYLYTPVQDGEKIRYLFVNAELVLFGYLKAKPVSENANKPELWRSIANAEERAKYSRLGIWQSLP